MLIDANHLNLTLNAQPVLKDVNLHMEAGEIYGLLGPNGAGKSTTIAVLLGLYAPDKGALMLFEGSAAGTSDLRRRIGVMPEHAGFYEWMNATDYLAWYAGFYGGMQSRPQMLLTRVGLAEAGSKPISQFSRGMKQRLALARALVHGPELLILDEPTNGLDPRGRREIHDLLLELADKDGVGILLCTHLLDDVERLCSRIGIIDKGRTVLEGSLDELLAGADDALRFRLYMTQVPPGRLLPPQTRLSNWDGDWWTIEIDPKQGAHLGKVWEDLLVNGWSFSEIRAEHGGLEELYLRLTDSKSVVSREKAA